MKKSIPIIVIFFILISVTCFKKPKWQISITIPLVSKFCSIQSLIDTNYIKIDSDSSLQFFISGNLDTIFLLDSIHFNDRADTFETKLFDFVFNGLTSTSISLTPDEILGVPLPDTTINTVISPFNRTINKTLNFTNIGSAFIHSGVLQVKIINNSHLTFDTINCCLSNYEIIHLTDIDSLSNTEYTQHLYNVSLESIASFVIYFASQGSNDDTIPISRYDSIKFTVKFDSLKIDSGCFRSIPPRSVRTTKTKIYSLSSNYQIRISDLIFHTGQLSLNLRNQFPLPIVLQCSIPEMLFDTTLQIPPSNPINFSIDLANRSYHNPSDSLTPITFRTIIDFLLDSTFMSLGPENSVSVSYLINNIQIDSIAGTIIDTIRHNFRVDSITISLPDFLQKIEAVNVVGVVNMTNAVAFPLNLRLHASATSSSGNESIDTMFLIAEGTPTNPNFSALSIDFTDLFNIHPTHISLNVEILSVGSGWMNRVSYSTASYTLSSPLRIILKTDTLAFNPALVRISEKICNLVRDYGDSSVFYAQLQNHIPARLSGDIIIENLAFDTVRIGITIPSGIIDNNSGLVIAPSDSNIAVSLDSLATKIFTDSIINVSVLLYIPDTDTITVSGRDYFKLVNSYAKVNTKPVPK
jgi:hypothetical protein